MAMASSKPSKTWNAAKGPKISSWHTRARLWGMSTAVGSR